MNFCPGKSLAEVLPHDDPRVGQALVHHLQHTRRAYQRLLAVLCCARTVTPANAGSSTSNENDPSMLVVTAD